MSLPTEARSAAVLFRDSVGGLAFLPQWDLLILKLHSALFWPSGPKVCSWALPHRRARVCRDGGARASCSASAPPQGAGI